MVCARFGGIEVGIRKRANTWEAYFSRQGRYIHVGSFGQEDLAIQAEQDFLQNEFKTNLQQYNTDINDVICVYTNYFISKEGILFNRQGKRIKTSIDRNGYEKYNLTIEGKQKFVQIHRLVLQAFCPHPNSDNLQVNHKNGIKSDNRLENLEWMTRSENTKHSIDNQLQTSNGRNNILQPEQLELIKKYHKQGLLDREIAEILGYGRSGISRRIREMGLR